MSADQAAVPAAVPPPAAAEVPATTEQGIKVFAGNLAYSADEAALRAFFAPVERDIVSVQVIMRGHRSAGYGFVAVKDQAAAEKAVAELDKKELDGRPVIVEVAKPNEQKPRNPRHSGERRPKKRIGGRRGDKAVPGEVTEAEANGEAAPAARIDDAPAAGETTGGEGAGPAKPRKKRFNKKKKAKVNQTESGAAPASTDAAPVNGNSEPAAASSPPAEAKERKPRKPRQPRPPRAPREVPTGPPSKSVLFVANLAFSVDEEALTQMFVKEGISVATARVVRRRWGNPRRSKGYGFVDVGNEQEQQKAIGAVSGKELAGRPITVKVAVDSDKENKATDDEEAVPAAAAAAAPA